MKFPGCVLGLRAQLTRNGNAGEADAAVTVRRTGAGARRRSGEKLLRSLFAPSPSPSPARLSFRAVDQ